ncbi:MAG: prephenate dehydrogenase/arogenate dehydrogenase family protein [Candidatus Moranbacteria bacterium]|nr:prephenate dehydrogenase/arogenate dehydrogenase family protein [Candidatus Moranbacteria bacterium]
MQKKTIGIFGFGDFGKLAASILSKKFSIKVFDKKKNPKDLKIIKKIGVKFESFNQVSQSDIVILAVPISQTEQLIKKIAPKLKKDSLVLDVCSVKVYPCKWLKKYLPKKVQVIGTHPMFGPQSTNFDFKKQTWSLKNLQIILCPIRIENKKLEKLKNYLKKLKLDIIQTTAQNHDRQAARSLGFVHFLAKTLYLSGFKDQKIKSKGYQDLLKTYYTIKDSPQLLFDMQNFNPYAKKIRQDFLKNFKKLEEKSNKAKQS